jgi:hypothetical protein
MGNLIHFISNSWDSKFIIAKTGCGRHYQSVDEYTNEDYIDLINCKKCLKTIKKWKNQQNN